MILEFSIVHREDILQPAIETQVWIKIVSLRPLLSELPPFQTQTEGCSCLTPLTLLTLRCQTRTRGCKTFFIRDKCAYPDSLVSGPAFFGHPQEPSTFPLRLTACNFCLGFAPGLGSAENLLSVIL